MNFRIRQGAGALVAIVVSGAVAAAQTQFTVASPDARTEVTVKTADGHLVYTVLRDGHPLVSPSMLGFEFRGAPTLRDSLRLTGSSRKTYDSTWTQPWGEVA